MKDDFPRRNRYLRTDGQFIVGIPKGEFRRGRLYGIRFVVASAFRDIGPATMEAVAKHIGLPANTVSGRVTDLRKMGYIRPTGRLVKHPWCKRRSVEYEFVDKPEPILVETYDDEERKLREIIEHFRKRLRSHNQNDVVKFYGWEVSMLLTRIERSLEAMGRGRKRGRLTQERATRA